MRTTRAVLAFALGAGVPGLVAQQAPTRPPVWLVPKADTVFVYLSDTPPANNGFVVYRTGPLGTAEKRTAQPVSRVREPAVAAGQLGPDLPLVMRALRAVDPGEMYRRMFNDPFAAGVLSGVSRNAALVLGRLYVDTGAARGGTYQYRIVFTDGTGAETTRSITAQVRVADSPPPTPTQLKVTVGDREAKLGWSYPPYRGGAQDFALGFHVYRAEGQQGPFRRLTETPVLRNDASPLEFRDPDVRNGGTYRYQITAADVIGQESPPTTPVSALVKDQTAPEGPTDLSVQEGNGMVLLAWRLSPEVDVAGYNLERSRGPSGKFERLNRALIPVQQPTWTDTVAAGRYFYRVFAVDASGNVSGPSTSLSAISKDTVPPDPPSRVVISTTARRLTIRWAPTRSRGVLGYFVYRGDRPDRLVRLMSGPITATQFVDSGFGGHGLRPGDKYFIRVSAVDSSFNESTRAEAEFAVPDDEAPSPPTALIVRNVSGRYVEVSWSGSSSLDVQWYELSRAAGDSALRVVGRYPSTERTMRDTTVAHGRRYAYALMAIDSAGNRSSAVKDTVGFRDVTAPPPPRMVTARATPTGVTVTWERVIESELVGYNVYRSAIPTGIFERLTRAPVRVLTFSDSTGKRGLFYLVRAVDRSGNESSKSPVAEVIP